MNIIATREQEASSPILDMAMGPWLSPHLRAALQHAFQSSGSGFRSRLAEALCQACRIDEEATAGLCTALEYFHLASLLLDDLPCMDNANTRRGLPCTHKVYGESMTILAALAMINRAYFHVWNAVGDARPGVASRVNELLDQCLGLNGVLNGQALDLKFNTTDQSASTVERIALLKTGSLLRLSILLPAVIGGVDKHTLRELRRLADKWGCVYQLLDDMKDLECSETASGKTSMQDIVHNRPNLALKVGRENAVARLRAHFSDCRELLDEMTLANALQPFQSCLEKSGQAFLSACAA